MEALARARRVAGLSQRELGARAGVAYPRISEYERGRRSPTLERLEGLVDEIGGRLIVTIEEPMSEHDRQLIAIHLAMTPASRLETLKRFARLRGLAAR